METVQTIMRGLIALVILGTVGYMAWIIWAPEPPKELSVTVPDAMPSEERALVTDAVDALVAICPGVLEAADDVFDVEATVETTPQGGAEKYGWTRSVILSFTFDEDVTGIPFRYLDPNLIYAGHTVRFLMGAGDRPGVIVEKAQAATLCETDKPAARNHHIPSPEMALIDR